MISQTMTEAELETQILDAMDREGLLPDVDIRRSMFLDVGDHLHTHVVLADSTRLSEARQVVAGEVGRLKAQGIRLDAIVRGAWSLRDAEFLGNCHGPNGQPMTSIGVRVGLTSGKRAHSVTIAITYLALETIKGAAKQESSDPAGARRKAAEVAQRFVEWNLSHGGDAYWDPTAYDRLELNCTTAEVLLRQMKAGLVS